MVVPVFIISCQVSLKPNIGPVIAQIMMTATARKKVPGLPAARAVHLANRENHDWDLVGLIVFLTLDNDQMSCTHLCRQSHYLITKRGVIERKAAHLGEPA